METKHTAGPWKVVDTSIVTDDVCIAVIEDDGGYEAPSEARDANARLIAAAPALLAACEAVIANAYLDDDVINRHAITTVGCESLRAVVAAIRLAKEGANA